jgi:hypothetical protein
MVGNVTSSFSFGNFFVTLWVPLLWLATLIISSFSPAPRLHLPGEGDPFVTSYPLLAWLRSSWRRGLLSFAISSYTLLPSTSLLPDPNERGAQPLEEDILIDYYIDSKVLFSHTIHVQCEFTLMDNDGRSLSHRSSVPRAYCPHTISDGTMSPSTRVYISMLGGWHHYVSSLTI